MVALVRAAPEPVDKRLHVRELVFSRPLETERLGLGRWTAFFLGRFGSYGKNDLVDVQYELCGRTMVATGLDIVAPSRVIRSGGLARSPQP